MHFDLHNINLRALNSATKYPSIPTYHGLGQKGALVEEDIVSFADQNVIATEKVDGTNSRVILTPDGSVLIGSREELLHALGDLVHNPALGIVDTLRATAELVSKRDPIGMITTFYFETFGGKTTAAAKQYTGNRAFGLRLFDVSFVEVAVLEKDPSTIAEWRDNGGQSFADEGQLEKLSGEISVSLTPRVSVSELTTTIEATFEWLETHLPETLVALDEAAGGQPEGLVVRTADRSNIAKIRYADYRRHLKRRK